MLGFLFRSVTVNLLCMVLLVVHSSLDVNVVPGDLQGSPETMVHISTNDWQEWCLKLNTAESDQYLECTIGGLYGGDYNEHCIYASSDYKVRACCPFCCAPLNTDEILHYAQTGGWWLDADKMNQIPGIGQKRCVDQDTYCSRMRRTCDASFIYAAEVASVEQYILDNHLELVPQAFRPASMQTLS